MTAEHQLAEWFEEHWIEEHGRRPATKWEICGHCHGNGTSTSYLGAYTQSDREEMGEEWYEFAEDVRRGAYDQNCDECGGSGKVREYTGAAAEAWHTWLREEYADRHTRWAESGYSNL